MSWYCECGQKLKGDEAFCPSCSAGIVYRCKRCGKEMADGSKKKCPACNTLAIERRENTFKACAKVVGVAGGVVALAISKTRKS